jgi:uncharacterized cupin superfamily protein
MAKIFNPKDIQFEIDEAPFPEYTWHTSPDLAEMVKSKHLKFDIRSLDPGKFSCPYHFHRNAEEIFVVMSGKVMLRMPDNFKELSAGDIAFFEMGPEGAHQLYNHTEEPCVFLDIRTIVGLDVCEYPDSGKINIIPFGEIFQKESRVDYYKGEEHVSEKWPDEIIKKDHS